MQILMSEWTVSRVMVHTTRQFWSASHIQAVIVQTVDSVLQMCQNHMHFALNEWEIQSAVVPQANYSETVWLKKKIEELHRQVFKV